jgi:uncharacterized protein YjeT (DUF2065 family)
MVVTRRSFLAAVAAALIAAGLGRLLPRAWRRAAAADEKPGHPARYWRSL